jgi:hypothetical protein
MILKITTVLFLIHSLDMLSRLLARRRDVFYDVSKQRGTVQRDFNWNTKPVGLLIHH